MIYRVAVLNAVLLAGIGLTIPAYAGVSNIQDVNGTCSSSSHTAEGPLGSDLTKRQSRFYCDSAIITFFDDYPGHVMIQFAQKESQHSPILGFAGRIEARQPGDVGTMIHVDSVYLAPGQATTVSDGSCKLFSKNRHLSELFCGMKVDETGRRTTAVVVFDVAPGQQQPAASNAPSQPHPIEPKTQQDPPKMGRDDMAGGRADDKWQKIQSGGREIFVMTNGYYSGGMFHTYIVANLPESTIVGAPRSVMNDVEGNCGTRHYHVLGSLFFAGKNRSGMAMQSTPPEDVERKIVSNSPFEKAFDMLCQIARKQK